MAEHILIVVTIIAVIGITISNIHNKRKCLNEDKQEVLMSILGIQRSAAKRISKRKQS